MQKHFVKLFSFCYSRISYAQRAPCLFHKHEAMFETAPYFSFRQAEKLKYVKHKKVFKFFKIAIKYA